VSTPPLSSQEHEGLCKKGLTQSKESCSLKQCTTCTIIFLHKLHKEGAMIEFRIGNLAALLGVHRNTVRNWIKRGQLKAKPTIGKRYSIDEGQLLAFCREAGVPEEKLRMLFSNAESGVLKSSETMETFASEGDMSKQPVGAVMVVGGGVSGIQASLDLADSGYYVYLVEKSAGIGGVMAQLDKTFPTNDCAM